MTKAELVAGIAEKLQEPKRKIILAAESVFDPTEENLAGGEKCALAGWRRVRDKKPRPPGRTQPAEPVTNLPGPRQDTERKGFGSQEKKNEVTAARNGANT
jgi:nucleoid DNA-binding protein